MTRKGREEHGNHQDRADEKAHFPGGIQSPAATEKRSCQPATRYSADRGDYIKRTRPPGPVIKVQFERFVQKIGKKELVEGPRRRRENSGDDIGPYGAIPEQRKPWHLV